MQYLNWGSETPEQKKRREQLEYEAMLNKAMQIKVFEQRAAAPSTAAATSAAASAAAGAAGGAPAPTEELYLPSYYMNNPDEYAY